jgi:quercetin dioxygenase-like cupin family protein
VLCTEGELTLVQEIGGKEVRTTLRPGEYAINEPGVWHTADVDGRATGVFITAGVGTEVRPRTKSS